MALVNMKDLLKQADEMSTACGAFNVGNMEMVMGVIKAAEESRTPVIMQIAEGRLKYSPLELLGPVMIAAAKQAKVDIAVHLDHGKNMEVIKKALDLGFTSVMFDGSAETLEDNIHKTSEVVTLAKKYKANVECEIGVIGGSEGDGMQEVCYTDPEEARRLSRETGADAMAVAIGNAHGHYHGNPKLRFDILNEIRQVSALPLVLHGGSGITAAEFQHAIKSGIRKVNIATASFDAAAQKAAAYLSQPDANYFGMSSAIVEGTYENIKKHIQIFNCK